MQSFNSGPVQITFYETAFQKEVFQHTQAETSVGAGSCMGCRVSPLPVHGDRPSSPISPTESSSCFVF